MRFIVPAIAAFVMATVGGCIEDGTEVSALDPSAVDGQALAEAAPLGLSATGCRVGGGHSVHPKMLNPLPEPWIPADVLGDVGPQILYSEVPDPQRPIPQQGNTIGNIHATMQCDGWLLDGTASPATTFGFVGMKVEAPPFGSPGPTHEYLVTVIASDDAEVQRRIQVHGIDPMHATASFGSQGGDLRIQMQTDRNGAYDSWFVPKDHGPFPGGWIRLWFQADGEEGPAPIAIDLNLTTGDHIVAEGQGYFSHTGTDHHAPLPGAYGHTAAVLWSGVDVTWSYGPRPSNVTLEGLYHH